MVRYLELLAAILQPRLAEWQPIVVLDAATCHLGAEVVAKANALGLWLLVVPANLTWLLQPLDAHVFSSYKAFLRREYLREASLSPDGVISDEKWTALLVRAATDFFNERDWSSAFAECGASGTQMALSETLSRQLRPCTRTDVLTFPRQAPSTEKLRCLFPRNRRPRMHLYFKHVTEAILAAH